MLPPQFTNDEHRGGRLINEIPARIDFLVYTPFELLF
jgi:hypothetical protein